MTKKITELHSLEPADLLNPLNFLIDEIQNIKNSVLSKKPTELLSRKQVAELLQTNNQTVINWTNKGLLKVYGISGRRYYKRHEVEQALIELN